MTDCPLCGSGRRAQRWTEALHKGTKSVLEAQREFGMSKEAVEAHLFQHSPTWNAVPAIKEEVSERDYYIRQLSQMEIDLHKMLEDVVDFNATSPDTIRSATSLTKEIRETLRLLGEITKVISNDETAELERAILDMRTNYLTLTNIVTTQCCPMCQKKILDAIDTQRKLLGK